MSTRAPGTSERDVNETRGQRNANFPLRRRYFATICIPILAIAVALLRANAFSRYFLRDIVALVGAVNLAELSLHSQPFPDPPYGLFSTNVVLPDDELRPALVAVDVDGKISSVSTSALALLFGLTRNVVDVSPLVVMPGLIDPHVHVNEPGRTSWEGFEHASRAAAAGGTTTILDMPLNNVPSTITADAFALKVDAMVQSKPLIDIGLIGGVVPQNADNFTELIHSGVLALKSFMVDSQSADFPNVSKEDLKRAVNHLHEYVEIAKGPVKLASSLPYILHAELVENQGEVTDSLRNDHDHFSYVDYETTRPVTWETDAVRFALETGNNTKAHIHIAHVSHRDVTDLISQVRASGLNHLKVTTETCPHYILWASEAIPRGTALWKCAPPIRPAASRERLRTSVFESESAEGGIDLIASDHSPCPAELKSKDGNLSQSWGGISGLQYRLQGSWTAAIGTNASITRMAELLSAAPARIFGLSNVKGSLKPGLDADMVIWDPHGEHSIRKEDCQHRYKESPFIGMKARGKIFHTLLRGKPVFSLIQGDDGTEQLSFGREPGRLLTRDYSTGEIAARDPAEWKAR